MSKDQTLPVSSGAVNIEYSMHALACVSVVKRVDEETA